MLPRSAFELMQADPAAAHQFYALCHKASKAYKKMRAQVSDGLIALAIENSHAVLMEINLMICTLNFPKAFDSVCMKFKMELENFAILCGFARKADLHSRLKFQMKVCMEQHCNVLFNCICRSHNHSRVCFRLVMSCNALYSFRKTRKRKSEMQRGRSVRCKRP